MVLNSRLAMAVLASGCMVSKKQYQEVKDELAAKQEQVGKLETAVDEANLKLTNVKTAKTEVDRKANDIAIAVKKKDAE